MVTQLYKGFRFLREPLRIVRPYNRMPSSEGGNLLIVDLQAMILERNSWF